MDRTPAHDTKNTAVVTLEPELGESVVARLWRVFCGEPMLLVTFGYLFVSVVGLWDSYWFYRRFDLPIMEFMQSSDYFVAGLRRPAYALLLVFVIVMSALALWPERWRKRYPERAMRVQAHWWGRLVIPKRSDWWAYLWLHPETMATLVAVFVVGVLLVGDSTKRAERIHRGGGTKVGVQLADAPTLLPGDWRLLGTSSAFVYVWNPAQRRAEALPLEAITRIVPMGTMPVPARKPDAAPRIDPVTP